MDLHDLSVKRNKALENAALTGDYTLVDSLLHEAAGNLTSKRGNRAINAAARNGHLAVVELLLANPVVDISDEDCVALQLAAKHGHLAVLQRLRADPRVRSFAICQAFGQALMHRHWDAATHLLPQGLEFSLLSTAQQDLINSNRTFVAPAAFLGGWHAAKAAGFSAASMIRLLLKEVEPQANALSRLVEAAARSGVAIQFAEAGPGLSALARIKLLRRCDKRVDAAFVHRESDLVKLLPQKTASAGAGSFEGTILMARNAGAAALARELGRSSLTNGWYDFRPFLKRGGLETFYWVLGMNTVTARDEGEGYVFSTLCAMCAAPYAAADIKTAARGYRHLREAGVGRLSSLRSFAATPVSLAMVAAPLLGNYAMRLFGVHFTGTPVDGAKAPGRDDA